jgi:hypothetical protein
MTLPAELRNKIYEFALSDDNGHHLLSRTKCHRRGTKRVSVKEFKVNVKGYGHRRRAFWRRRREEAIVGPVTEEIDPPFSRLTPIILAVSKGEPFTSNTLIFSSCLTAFRT